MFVHSSNHHTISFHTPSCCNASLKSCAQVYSELFTMKLLPRLLYFSSIISTSSAFIKSAGVGDTELFDTPAICKQHVVRDGDTCLGLARANNMSFSQMIAWNPILKPACV
jgi:hypothetical protein